jgi:hypothetical protein
MEGVSTWKYIQFGDLKIYSKNILMHELGKFGYRVGNPTDLILSVIFIAAPSEK